MDCQLPLPTDRPPGVSLHKPSSTLLTHKAYRRILPSPSQIRSMCESTISVRSPRCRCGVRSKTCESPPCSHPVDLRTGQRFPRPAPGPEREGLHRQRGRRSTPFEARHHDQARVSCPRLGAACIAVLLLRTKDLQRRHLAFWSVEIKVDPSHVQPCGLSPGREVGRHGYRQGLEESRGHNHDVRATAAGIGEL